MTTQDEALAALAQIIEQIKSITWRYEEADVREHGMPEWINECDQTIRAALAKPVEGEWMPIETAPRDGTRVLIAIEGASRAILAQCESDDRWWTVGESVNWENKNVTHWMPLPNPPQNTTEVGDD